MCVCVCVCVCVIFHYFHTDTIVWHTVPNSWCGFGGWGIIKYEFDATEFFNTCSNYCSPEYDPGMLRCGLWFSEEKNVSSGKSVRLSHSVNSAATRLLTAYSTKSRLIKTWTLPLNGRIPCGGGQAFLHRIENQNLQVKEMLVCLNAYYHGFTII